MQQFSETSSISQFDNVKTETILQNFLIFEVGNIKNEAILRDSFKNERDFLNF